MTEVSLRVAATKPARAKTPPRPRSAKAIKVPLTIEQRLALAHERIERLRADDWTALEYQGPLRSAVIPAWEPVVEFILDSQVCPTTNATRHALAWKHAAIKGKLWKAMLSQCRASPEPPIHHAIVRGIRWSAGKGPDPHADWLKLPVDMLQAGNFGRHRLGIIGDDRHVDLGKGWCPCPKNEGFVWIAVWSPSP